MVVLAVVFGLVVALLTGSLVLYQTKAMWKMDSPNAHAWNATLNATATFGVNVIPLIIIVIVVAFGLMVTCGSRGF